VPATDTTAAATSATATYKVLAVATATRAGARALTVAIGGLDSQSVQVQRLDGARWVKVKTFRAAARTTVTGLTAKKRYRIVVPNTPVFAGTVSATAQL
jgi:type 1 fimbria pilin